MFKTVIVALSLAALIFNTTPLYSQSEASAPFLLISPGARASGMGEANVAIADDAVGGYYNPAGIAWTEGRKISLMRAKWLPNLVDDISYNFLGYSQYIEGLGSIGGHLIYLDLGEQIQTGTSGPEEIGRFQSFMLAIAATYAADFSENSTVGINVKLVHQDLAPSSAGRQPGSGRATSFAFDVGLLTRDKFFTGLDLGIAIANIGPNVQFIDANQADPMPMNLKVGMSYLIFDGEFNSFRFAYDMNKLLVASYPKQGDRDAYKDPFYKAFFTSWTDDSPSMEWQKIIHNLGFEYWYAGLVALRGGVFRDFFLKNEDNSVALMKTLGIGIRYNTLGFDFGYVDGPEGHPLTNTMRFSIDMNF